MRHCPFIEKHAVATALAQASVKEIDEMNILWATMLAMQRAINGVEETFPRLSYIRVDGNRLPKMDKLPSHISLEAIIKGDLTDPSISAASILAKVHRDRLMAELATKHPHYAWERNAGYGTAAHQNGLAAHGITPHHRKSFAPIRKIVKYTTAIDTQPELDSAQS